MDTKDKERVRRPQSEKPKGRPPVQGKGKAKQNPARTAGRTDVKGQAQQRKASQQKKKRSIAEDVVYLPPKPFSRKRLLLRLASVVAVVFALFFSVSIFFKVEKVVVSGNVKYSAEAILEASGIQVGDKLLTFSRAKAGGKIIGKLPFVENVRFGINLPGTVYIEITEVEVSYAAADTNGAWWLISANGKVLQKLSGGENSGYTNLLGFKLDKPVVGNQAVPLEEGQPTTDEEGNTIPVVMTAEKRLSTALNILQYLEQNGIIGEAAYLDVTDLGNISMQYGSRFQIQLGDDTQLSYKISLMKAAVAKVVEDYPYSAGTLYLSDPEDIRFDRDES